MTNSTLFENPFEEQENPFNENPFEDPEDFGKQDAEKEALTEPSQDAKKKKGNSCSASASKKVGKTSTPATPPKPKDPPEDLPLLVVLTNYNVQKEYPAGTTLEAVRQELELEYPAYSKENTSWHWEEQRDKGRVLCIPGMRSNKAG